ncbi:MAG: hypothetical protein KY469_21555, partial [Actinobacteria bacterium]|nr:hypothetical protein [Actinomycetota bacterium]
MGISTLHTAAVVLMTLLLAAPHAAASSADAASGPAASYGADHLVVAGAVEPGWSSPPTWLLGDSDTPRFEYLAYYPTELQIHRGDVVFFRSDGFHTVTFGPEGQPREGLLRRDEVEPLVALQHDFPSDPTCGTSAEAPPCVLDDTDEFVNSGVNDLKLAVDLPEGAYTYYCTIHTGMQGTIEIVPDEEPIATPAEVEADRQADIEADTATAHDILADPPEMRGPEQVPASDTSPAHRRWFVQAGEVSADQRVVVLQYFPSSLTIAPGDEVEIGVPAVGEPVPGRVEPVAEHHTVTFEPRAVHDNVPGLVHYLNPMCDPDDPEHGLPGVPLFPALVLGCPDGLTLELGLQPWAYQDPLRAPGNAVATEATLHDSGVLVPPDNPCRTGCDPWT